jgi:enolase-phosphatase E1
LFSDFFDTGVGSKTERGSYVAIGRAIGTAPDAILFLSDSAAELRAAESAGLQVAQAVKEASLAEPRWTAVADFSTINVAPRP